MPPSTNAREKALAKWRNIPEGYDFGPMTVQQQQQERVPQQQRLQQQRGSMPPRQSHGTGGKPKTVSREQADKARDELEKKGQVLPDGSKKKPLPGEIAGAA